MQSLQIKVDDITEDMISDLIQFLDSGVIPEGKSESQLAVLYGRLKARGNKIDKAEERLDIDRKKKQENYKRKVLNDIKQGIQEMKNENGMVGHYVYEIVNIKDWEDGKTMQIGFRDVDSDGKTRWRKSVLIEEIYNPEFFNEMLEKYRPQEAEPELKPF